RLESAPGQKRLCLRTADMTMPQKTLHFKSKTTYNKWLAYDHIHNTHEGEHPVKVDIAGEPHEVHHDGAVHIAARPTRRENRRGAKVMDGYGAGRVERRGGGSYLTAHPHKRGHHGGKCDGACRRG